MYQPYSFDTQFQRPDYRVKIPNMRAVAEGYAYAGTDQYGSLMSAPEAAEFNKLAKFSSNLMDPSITTRDADTVKFLNDEYYSTLNTIGISSKTEGADNFRTIGMNSAGTQMFSVQHMSTSKDYQLGAKMVKNATDLIGAFEIPTGKQIFDEEEQAKFAQLSETSQNPAVIADLDASRNANDEQGFLDKFWDYVTPGKKKVTKSAKDEIDTEENESKLLDSVATAYQAYGMYEMWDYMSPAQKAAGLASVGIKGYELASGEKLGKKVLVDATHRADGSEITPALTVEGALDAFSAGINAYSLAKNWDQLSDVSRIIYGVRTVKSIMQAGKSLNLLGSGVNSAATVANAGQLAAAGYQSVPHLGIGAMVGPASSGVPAGYTAVTYTDDFANAAGGMSAQGGKNVVIVPTKNANTAAGATSNAGSVLNTAIGYGSAALSAYGAYESFDQGDYIGGGIQAMQAYAAYSQVAGASAAGAGAAAGGAAAGGAAAGGGAVATPTIVGAGQAGAPTMLAQGSTAAGSGAGGVGAGASTGQMIGGAAMVAAGAYMIYQNWGQGGSEGAKNGAIGGASMAAGLYMMGAIAPWAAVAIIAVGALLGTIKSGKHKDQKARDQVRSQYQRNGFVDENWEIELADGSRYNIGMDGKTGMHDWLDSVKAAQYGDMKGHDRLRSYDVDYTNDIEYMSSLGGIALSRMIAGGSATNVDQMGGQLGNGFVSNIDTSDGVLTEEKYRKMIANQRAVYAKAGIKTKADGFALANQLFAEGRINDFEVTQMHQALNMIFDADSYEYAMQLVEGRWRGIEAIMDHQGEEDDREVELPEGETPPQTEEEEEEELTV